MKTLILFLSLSLSVSVFGQNGKYMGQVKINPIPVGQSLNFNIMSGNPSTAFKLDSKTGELTINNQSAIDAHGWNYTLGIRLRYSQNNVILRDSMVNFKITPDYAKLVNEIRVNPVPNGQSINFYIMSGNPSTAFKIEPSVGAIFINNQTALDGYNWYYTLVVRLRYSKNGVVLADTMRTIRILNMMNGQSIGKMVATDPDNARATTQKLSFYFMSGNYSTAYRIDGTTGYIYINNVSAINSYMTTNTQYVINVRARDNGTPYKEDFGNATIKLFGGLPRQDVFNCRLP
jgi:hypothetical protein